eukprot:jgi/Botrbrau1/18869/Bobra.177_2s0029.1
MEVDTLGLVSLKDVGLDVLEAIRNHLPKATWPKFRGVCREWRMLFSRDLHRATITKQVIQSALRRHRIQGQNKAGALDPLWVHELSCLGQSFQSLTQVDLCELPLESTNSVQAFSFLGLTPSALALALPHFATLRMLCLFINAANPATPAIVAELESSLMPFPQLQLQVHLGEASRLSLAGSNQSPAGDPVLTPVTLRVLSNLPSLVGFSASVLALSSAAPARAAYVREIAAMTRLRKLSLVGVPSADLHPWAALMGLTSLQLEAMWARDEALMFLTALSGLEHLQLRSARFTARIPSMVAVATSLTRLALFADGHGHIAHTLTDECLQDLSSLSRLADLSLNRERLTGKFMQALGGLLPLTRLALLPEDSEATCSTDLTDAGLEAVSSATGLQELLLIGCSGVRGESMTCLSRLSRLTHLHCSGSALEFKVDVLKTFTSLRVLTLDWVFWRHNTNGRCNFGALLRRLRTLTNLQELSLKTAGSGGGLPEENEIMRFVSRNQELLMEEMPNLRAIKLFDHVTGRFNCTRLRIDPA